MKTLAGVAHGLSRNLIERAADVMLKERRPLIIVPRETPMSLPQLRNMVLCAEAGRDDPAGDAGVLSEPQTIDDLADFMAGKILAALGFEHHLYPAGRDEREPAGCPCAARRQRRDDKTRRGSPGMFDAIAAALRPAQPPAERRPGSPLARRAVVRCALTGRERVLDMCTGTADLAIELARRGRGGARGRHRLLPARCCGSAQAKVRRRLPEARRGWPGDAMRMPLPSLGGRGDDRVRDPQREEPAVACAEICRVLGRAAASPSSSSATPRDPGLRAALSVVLPHVLPRIGRVVSNTRRRIPICPPRSACWPPPPLLCERCDAAGFPTLRAVPLTFGVVYLYTAKPVAGVSSFRRVLARQRGTGNLRARSLLSWGP